MRVSITEMIRRPVSLAIVVIATFLVGVVAGSIGIPTIWRDEVVFVIGNATEDGCRGSAGATPIRFGRTGGASGGPYIIHCNELVRISDTVSLRCVCPKQ